MIVKDFFKPVMALMMLASVGVGVTSCSDSDDPIVATVNNGELKVDINRIGGTVEIPVESNGDWKVSVENLKNSDIEWAGIISDSVGKGSGKVIVAVDYLSPQEQIQERTADIVLECGGKSQTVKLRQYIGLKDGEAATNADASFTDLWANKGVGSGFNLEKGKQTTSRVLNMSGLIQLAENVKKYSTLFSQNKTAEDKIQLAISDTLESDTSQLAVKCTIKIKYAQFKLGIDVNYDNTGLLVQNAKNYNAEQSVTFLTSSVDLASISAILEDEPDSIKNQVASVGFLKYYDKIAKVLATDPDGESDRFKKLVKSLYDLYGPVVVSGAELGGSIFFSLRYDSIAQENNFKVNGKVTAAVPLGPVKIDGKVDVTYAKAGLDIWNNSQHFISASGGDQATLKSLTDLMIEKEPNLDKIQEAGQAWIHAITSSDNSNDNTAVIGVTYEGIWNLFPFECRDSMKEIAIEKYKGKTLCVDLEKIGLSPQK